MKGKYAQWGEKDRQANRCASYWKTETAKIPLKDGVKKGYFSPC
jgi:hypothetical protein